MQKILRRIKILSLLILGFSFITTPCWAAISISKSTSQISVIPVNKEGPALSFLVTASEKDELVSKFRIKNSNINDFGFTIKDIAVYVGNNDGAFSTGTDGDQRRLLQTVSFGDAKDLTLPGSGELIPSGSSVEFIITYKIEAASTVGASTNIELTQVNGTDLTTTFTNNIDISGFAEYTVTNIAPSFVIPGQQFIPMLAVTLQTSKEDIRNDLGIKITNSEKNFVSSKTETDGVTRVLLYEDLNGSGTITPEEIEANQTFIQVKEGGEFTSSSETTFYFSSISDGLSLSSSPESFFVVYDIGNTFSVTGSTSVKAQVTAVTGNGSVSRLEIANSTPEPRSGPASSKVAGLSYSSLSSIVPPNSQFGPQGIIPILKFGLRANQTTINVDAISMGNPGTTRYVTGTTDIDDIQRIAIYLDSDTDGEFDGVNSTNDTLIGNLKLAGSGNQTNVANIPIQLTNDELETTGLQIPPFNTSATGYPANNEKFLFAVYYTGKNTPQRTDASGNVTAKAFAQINNAEGTVTVNDTALSITLSGDLPAKASPEAEVELLDTNVLIINVQDISPTTVVQGQIKVPMLSMELEAKSEFTSSSITIANQNQTFTPESAGVTKVWIYRDDLPTSSVFDSTVSFVGANSSLKDKGTASIGSIPLFTDGINRFFVLYDIGLRSADELRAQLSGVSSGTTTGGSSVASILLGGQVPNPIDAASALPSATQMEITGITSPDANNQTDNTDTFNILITVKNNSSNTVTITDVTPRFYLSSISGKDITFEFTTQKLFTPGTMSSGEETTFQFEAKHTKDSSEGTVVIDGLLKYKTSDGSDAILSRYLNDGVWRASSPTTLRVNVAGSEKNYSWTLPAYIKDLKNLSGATSVDFANNNAIPANTGLEVEFIDSGSSVDEASITVFLNGIQLRRETGNSISSASFSRYSSLRSSAQGDTYSYDSTTGILTVADVGNQSGTLVIDANDDDGNALGTTTITFIISSNVSLSDALFYPNPYRIGSEDLKLGFNLTRPAQVTVSFFNYLGTRVHEEKEDIPALGYQLITFPKSSDFLSSGTYYVLLVAKDSSGNQSKTTTKLAIY